MVAITSAVLGAAALGYGLYSRHEAQQEQESANQGRVQGYQQMAGVAQDQNALAKEQSASSYQYAGYNFDLEKQSAEYSRQASVKSLEINRNIVTNEQAVQQQRRNAMEVDARRKQTEIIRTQQRARALALTTATSQGASQGSGLQGGYGQISGQTGTNLLGVSQGLQTGRNIFDLNTAITGQRLQGNDLENLFANQRADLQTQKSQMVYDYARVNAQFQNRSADLQTRASQAQGTLNLAGGQMEAAQSNAAYANSFISMAPSIVNMGQTANNVFAGVGSTPTVDPQLTNYGRYSNIGYGS